MAQSTHERPRLRVTTAWRASYDPALRVYAGETVTPGRKDTEHPGWQWVETKDRLGGWIPEAILQGTRISAGFDTVELTVATGDIVTCITSRSGWHWCRDISGREGWLPATHLSHL